MPIYSIHHVILFKLLNISVCYVCFASHIFHYMLSERLDSTYNR